MKIIQFLMSHDETFSTPKTARKLLRVLAWSLFFWVVCAAAFYMASRFNNQVSKQRRIMNDDMYDAQHYLYSRESLLMHLSRSIFRVDNEFEWRPERRYETGGEGVHVAIKLGDASTGFELKASEQDLADLDAQNLALIYISNEQPERIKYLYGDVPGLVTIPPSVLKKITTFDFQGPSALYWFSDPDDVFSRLYVALPTLGEVGGWLVLEARGRDLGAVLGRRSPNQYLLLDDNCHEVLGRDRGDHLDVFKPLCGHDSFGFTNNGLIPDYLALGMQVDESKWTLIYYAPLINLIRSLQGVIIGVVALCLLGAVFISMLVKWIDRRLIAPAQHRLDALIESEAFSRAVIETAPVALCVLRCSDGAIMIENSLCQAWGDVGGRRKLWRERLLECAHAVNKAETSFEWQLSDGRHLYMNIVPTRYKGNEVLFCAFSDISLRKEAEAEVARAKQLSDAANQAKSIFLATVSHEIRTPLYGLLGNLELLGLTELSGQQQNYLGAMQQTSSTLQQLINDVLDVSKIEAGQLELNPVAFSPLKLTQELIQMYSAVASRKGLHFYALCDPDVPEWLLGDVVRVRQILGNLLGNALKFTEQGRVVLRLRVGAGEGSQIDTYWQVADSGAGIAISEQNQIFSPFYQTDTKFSAGGTGLGLSICQRLTQLMSGEIKVVSDLGLGSSFTLSLPLEAVTDAALATQAVRLEATPVYVKCVNVEIAENVSAWLNHWGAIAEVGLPDSALSESEMLATVVEPTRNVAGIEIICNGLHILAAADSPYEPMEIEGVLSVNVNSIFGIAKAVRMAQRKEAQPVRDAFLAADDGLARKRILVAEDNPINQQLLKAQLQSFGCQVQLAGDGLEALGVLSSSEFDLIITDVNMPKMDGYELTRQIRRTDPYIPIVGATANAMQDEQHRCLASGMNACLIKPFDRYSLFNMLSSLLLGLNHDQLPCVSRKAPVISRKIYPTSC